ncbi:hypothetical protein [Cupriavidus pauculus]|uniref:hypothetical protein n=1 Tax=Cupriavidus pauculus TaxID=82633 RepID=UPI001D0CD6DA|nr:hypothetical protein [Cupriavidus pauculus]
MAKPLTHQQILALPLSQQGAAMAEYKLRARQAELKAMAPALLLLEAEHAAIKAAGCEIYADSLSHAFREKLTLHVMASIFDGGARLHRALLKAGFVISERDDSTHTATLHFKKGRLRLRMYMSLKDLARAEAPLAAQKEAA